MKALLLVAALLAGDAEPPLPIGPADFYRVSKATWNNQAVYTASFHPSGLHCLGICQDEWGDGFAYWAGTWQLTYDDQGKPVLEVSERVYSKYNTNDAGPVLIRRYSLHRVGKKLVGLSRFGDKLELDLLPREEK